MQQVSPDARAHALQEFCLTPHHAEQQHTHPRSCRAHFGSTGRSKGVLVSHGALAGYLDWAVGLYGFGGVVPLHSSLAFDLTVTSVFGPLLAGGCVRVSEPGVDGVGGVLGDAGVVKVVPLPLEALRQQFLS